MEKALEKMAESVRNKNYSKLLQVLEYIRKHGVELNNTELQSKFDRQEDILKMILVNDIQVSLCSGKEIQTEILEVTSLLDSSFQSYVEDIAVNLVVPPYIEEFKLKAMEIKYIGDLKTHLKWFEKKAEQAAVKYSYMPDHWDFSKPLVFNFCKETARALQKNRIGLSEEDDAVITAIKDAVNFEVKYTRNMLCKGVCVLDSDSKNAAESTSIKFTGQDVKVVETQNKASIQENGQAAAESSQGGANSTECFCRYRKCITSTLAKRLDIYVEHMCLELEDIKFEQEDYEMQIIRFFIVYFNALGKIYRRVSYFEDEDGLAFLGASCDSSLCRVLERMRASCDYVLGIVTANTLLFIEKTLYDFLNQKMPAALRSPEKWRSFEKIRCIEKKQFELLGKKVEDIVSESRLDIMACFSSHTMDVLKNRVLVFNMSQARPELTGFIFGSVFSTLFFKISRLKLSVYKAEHILSELSEIKSSLSGIQKNIPMLNTLGTYLKVYLVPPDDTENFVKNFLFVSGSKFLFTQILKKLENPENNAKLYMYYQSHLKEKVGPCIK